MTETFFDSIAFSAIAIFYCCALLVYIIPRDQFADLSIDLRCFTALYMQHDAAFHTHTLHTDAAGLGHMGHWRRAVDQAALRQRQVCITGTG